MNTQDQDHYQDQLGNQLITLLQDLLCLGQRQYHLLLENNTQDLFDLMKAKMDLFHQIQEDFPPQSTLWSIFHERTREVVTPLLQELHRQEMKNQLYLQKSLRLMKSMRASLTESFPIYTSQGEV